MGNATSTNMPTLKGAEVSPAWGKKRAPSRGPEPSLTATQIAHVAIEVPDADGLEAVTMQRIARGVGLTTMALYRYFSGKADLIDLMIDSASESPPNVGKPAVPRSNRLKKWARGCASIYSEHPWFLEATSARRSIMGPNELSWMESALAVFAESGLPRRDTRLAFLALIAHIRGHATFQQIRKQSESAEQRTSNLTQLLNSEADHIPRCWRLLVREHFLKILLIHLSLGSTACSKESAREPVECRVTYR
jgi:AcrR family transcriptional regulator